MCETFAMNLERTDQELRITASGEFDRFAARELLEFLRNQDFGQGRVVIDTSAMGRVHVVACELFKDGMKRLRPMDQWLVIIGDKGRAMSCPRDRTETMSRVSGGAS